MSKKEQIVRGNGAELLSIGEFSRLCQLFDLRKKEREGKESSFSRQVLDDGSGKSAIFQTVAPRTPYAKFDVLAVERGAKLLVLCCEETGEQLTVEIPEAPVSKFIRPSDLKRVA